MIIQTDFLKTDVFAELVQGDFWKKMTIYLPWILLERRM